jgi:hypothetical protein
VAAIVVRKERFKIRLLFQVSGKHPQAERAAFCGFLGLI